MDDEDSKDFTLPPRERLVPSAACMRMRSLVPLSVAGENFFEEMGRARLGEFTASSTKGDLGGAAGREEAWLEGAGGSGSIIGSSSADSEAMNVSPSGTGSMNWTWLTVSSFPSSSVSALSWL